MRDWRRRMKQVGSGLARPFKRLHQLWRRRFGLIACIDPLAEHPDFSSTQWVWAQSRHVACYTPLDLKRLPGRNHCSLTAITACLQTLRKQVWRGLLPVPLDSRALYDSIQTIALASHAYAPWRGTYVWRLPRLMRRILRAYRIDSAETCVQGRWLFRNPTALIDQITSLIDQDLPVILNLAWGDYPRHTVTCCGYRRYLRADAPAQLSRQQAQPAERIFLVVDDHWGRGLRTIDPNRLGGFLQTPFTLCWMTHPKQTEGAKHASINL